MALTDQQDHVYWIERDKIGIAKYAPNEDKDNQFTGPAVGKAITLFVVKEATALSADLTDVPGIPEEFHDALIFRAIQRGYELRMAQDPKIVNTASYFRAGFEKAVKEGKKYANKGRDGSSWHIKHHDF